jgi:hypothetical protein
VRGIAMGKNVPGFLRPASEFLPPSDRGRGGGVARGEEGSGILQEREEAAVVGLFLRRREFQGV